MVEGEAVSYFRAHHDGDGEWLEPLEFAQAEWGDDHLQGPAVLSSLARGAGREARRIRPDFVPSRIGCELFRAARSAPTRIRVEVIRDGPRLLLIDAFFEQSGRAAARGHFSFVRPGPEPEDVSWSSAHAGLSVPPKDQEVARNGRAYRVEAGDWAPDALTVTAPGRRFVWQRPTTTVLGEKPVPLEWVAGASDLANMTLHWTDTGVQIINADVTTVLTRLPEGDGVGMTPLSRSEGTGLSAGAVVLYDERGEIGVVSMTGLVQSRVKVGFVPGGFLAQEIAPAGSGSQLSSRGE